jgi:hypothetical protein
MPYSPYAQEFTIEADTERCRAFKAALTRQFPRAWTVVVDLGIGSR